jgi:hypothetical protein
MKAIDPNKGGGNQVNEIKVLFQYPSAYGLSPSKKRSILIRSQ